MNNDTRKDSKRNIEELNSKEKGKGKGKGKKTRPTKIINCLKTKQTDHKNTERKKHRPLASETSSSESEIEMSVHSDSDLLDLSDGILESFDQSQFFEKAQSAIVNEVRELDSNQRIEPILATHLTNYIPEILELKETQQNVTPVSRDYDETQQNITPVSQDNEIKMDLVQQSEPVPGPSRETEVNVYDNYDVGSSVLVRYIMKKKVQYFVGHILSKSGPNYTISFLKKTGRSDSTKFIKPKKKDIDTVNVTMIIKEIELLAINDNETEFVFLDDEDIFFFEY